MSTKSEGFAKESKVRREFRVKNSKCIKMGDCLSISHVDFD